MPEDILWQAIQSEPALVGMVRQHAVTTRSGAAYILDFADPGLMVAIEVDGLAYHNGQDSFTADRRRQRRLEGDGWRVVRFAAREVTDDPHGCACDVVALISMWHRQLVTW